jgi:hypothetical protein
MVICAHFNTRLLKSSPLCTKMSSTEDTDTDNDGEDPLKYKTTISGDWQSIFYGCRITMVNGHVKKGVHIELARQLGISRVTVSRQWGIMSAKLAALLCNHPGEEHIISSRPMATGCLEMASQQGRRASTSTTGLSCERKLEEAFPSRSEGASASWQPG